MDGNGFRLLLAILVGFGEEEVYLELSSRHEDISVEWCA